MKPLFACFSQNLDYALGWMVIHSLWQATLIAFITGALNIALRKKTAKLRYIVSNISLFLVLAMSVATFCYYYDFNKEAKDIVFIETQATTQPITIQQFNNAAIQAPLSIEAFKDYFNHNLPLIVTIWVLGVAIFILKLLGSVSYIYYLKSRLNFPTDEYWNDMMHRLAQRAGITKSIELVESALVRTPMVIGHLKPMILFPLGIINRLAPQEVEAILAHEIAHILRHDYLFNIFQSIVEALFYFHPAVWWLSNQIRNERESACDEMAIELINNKLNYAKALVSIQEMAYFSLSPALGFAGQRKNQLLMRMQRILNQQQNKTTDMEKIIASLLIVCTLFGLVIGQSQNKKAETPSVEPTTTTNIQSPVTTESTTINAATNNAFSNITTIGDTFKNPIYSFLPPTPEIIALQKELAAMEKEFPNFEKEKEAQIVKLKQELADMEKGVGDFENKKQAEIDEVEKEIAGMKANLPTNENKKQAEIAEIQNEIKKKEAELIVFSKKIEEENKKIEAQIAELKKESEGKTGTKRSRVEGDIQGLYGDIQGNYGTLQGKKGDIQGLYGDIQGKRGEMQGNRGELQGKHGEIQGKRGEIQGKHGEIQGKRGEIQGIRGEIQGKRGEIQGKRGEIQGKYTELMFKTLVADLKSDNIITDDKRLFLHLNQKEFFINNVKQSDALHAKYKAKYLQGTQRGFEIYKRDGNLNFSMDDDDN